MQEAEQNMNINFFIEIDLIVSGIRIAFEKKCPSNWHYEEKNGRQSHGLVFVIDGAAEHCKSGEKFTIEKNDILFLPKGSKYVNIGNSLHMIVVSFDVSNDSLFRAIPLKEVTKVSNSGHYSNLFHELASLWFYKGVAYRMKCISILQDILFHLVRQSIQQEMHLNHLHKIQPAVDYMEACYDKPVRIEELADMSNISVSHFRRLFTEIFKLSPVEYMNSIRISKAKDLIMSEMYSISEIATKVGYPNIYYFSRVFKKFTGQSPTHLNRRL